MDMSFFWKHAATIVLVFLKIKNRQDFNIANVSACVL